MLDNDLSFKPRGLTVGLGAGQHQRSDVHGSHLSAEAAGDLDGRGCHAAADVEHLLTFVHLCPLEQFLSRASSAWVNQAFAQDGEKGIRVESCNLCRREPGECLGVHGVSSDTLHASSRILALPWASTASSCPVGEDDLSGECLSGQSPGTERLTADRGAPRSGAVSRKRQRATAADSKVIAATVRMAAGMPATSAMTPATRAPAA